MWYELFPGLSFWLNWVMVTMLIIAVVMLTVSYVMMSSAAPLLKPGERRDEHVLHQPRFFSGLLAAGDGFVAVILLVMSLNDRVGWVLVGVSVIAVLFSALIIIANFMQAADWRRKTKEAALQGRVW